MLRNVVADASALVEYLFRTARARAIEAVVENPDVDLHVPALCDLEVASALGRTLFSGRIDDDHAERVLEAYLDLPLIRHGHAYLLARALELRDYITMYDAMYVVLAERLTAALLTGDAALGHAARRHAGVEVVASR